MAEIETRVAIVGGGMVGAALALALARDGMDVALLEVREPKEEWPADSYDLRVSALTQASKHIFQHLGAWQGMLDRRATPYSRMEVWDAKGFGHIHFDAAETREAELGFIIENRVIQRALWDRVEAMPERIRIFCPAQVEGLLLDEQQPQLTLADGSVITTQLVVAADGNRSKVRELAAIGTKGWPYDQTAVVATVRAEFGHSDTAWQRFMPTGPLALLPTGKDLFSIVWSTSPVHTEELLAMSPEAFGQAVAQASEYRCGGMTLIGERAAYPLRLQHATQYVKPGLALVGDAAHVIHPLAGQGVNLGLLDAAGLRDVLLEAVERKRPLGAMSTLRRYERARVGDNMATQGAMEGFKRLFSNDITPLRLLRNLGMEAANRLPPVKDFLVNTAMATRGELPRLARPTIEH